MKLINLTPHTVSLFAVEDTIPNGKAGWLLREGAEPREVFPSQGIARATQTETLVGNLDLANLKVPVFCMAYGDVYDLPEPQENIGYIVSYITAAAAKAHGRSTDDLFIVARMVRDNDGNIVGCTAFSQL